MTYTCKTCFYLAVEDIAPYRHFNTVERLYNRGERIHHVAIYNDIKEDVSCREVRAKREIK